MCKSYKDAMKHQFRVTKQIAIPKSSILNEISHDALAFGY